MFGLFKSKKSPLRQRLDSLLFVSRTWFEWSLVADQWMPTLIVETAYDTDPGSPDFYGSGLEQVLLVMRDIAAADPTPLPPVRVIPRKYE